MRDQDYFTASELAERVRSWQLDGLPTTARGFQIMARRDGWDDLSEHYTRPRASAGPGRAALEYHRSILPEVLQDAINAHSSKATASTGLAPQPAATERQAVALRVTQLPRTARNRMGARAEVLGAIDSYAVTQGISRAQAITAFVEAQAAHADRQEIEHKRGNGQVLTDDEMRSLADDLQLTGPTGFGLDPAVLAQANARKGGTVSRSTIYAWFKMRDAQGVGALAPDPTRAAQPVPDGFADFLKFYARPSKPSMADAHGEYCKAHAASGKVEPALTLAQVRYVLNNRMNNIERNVGREGLLTLRARLPYVTRTTEGMWPATVYSADGKTFDAEIADPVSKHPIRPEITTVIDIVTRKVVGVSYARSENQRTVAEALRRACVDHAIPAIFYVDRGPGYRNQALDADIGGLMGRLGITKSHALPYGSQAKGRVERIQNTIWNVLAKRLPTYIGTDQDMEAGQNVHKLTRRELKQFGQSQLLPDWDEFVALAEAMVAEYNARPHRGLPKFRDPETGRMRHMSPDEAWDAHVENGVELITVDPAEADDLFRPYEVRTCQRGLVRWNGNQYFDEALEPYHNVKVMVGYDYVQADRVWVRELDRESGQPGRLICVARFGANEQRYFPVSSQQAAEETRLKGRLRRLDDKMAQAKAEVGGLVQIEARPEFADTILEHVQEYEPEILHVAEVPAASAPIPRKHHIRSDEDLAAWAIRNPSKLSENQIATLRRVLSRPIGRENLRANGIDTEALQNLLRAAVA